MDKLPRDLRNLIYEHDPTHRENYNDIIEELDKCTRKIDILIDCYPTYTIIPMVGIITKDKIFKNGRKGKFNSTCNLALDMDNRRLYSFGGVSGPNMPSIPCRYISFSSRDHNFVLGWDYDYWAKQGACYLEFKATTRGES